MPMLSTKSSDILRGGRALTRTLHSQKCSDPWEPSWFQTCKCCLFVCNSSVAAHSASPVWGQQGWQQVKHLERSCSCIADVLLQPCCKRAHGNGKYTPGLNTPGWHQLWGITETREPWSRTGKIQV